MLPVFLITAAFLILLEIGFRVQNWFYDYEGWESPALMKKMGEADKLFHEKGRIDLITMSTSVGRVWDVRQWEEATSGSIVAYNFGYPNQRPEKQYFLFKNYIYPRYHPKYLVYGISPGDCNSNIHGMDPRNPRQGPFWSYRNIQAMDAKTVLDKIESKLENISYLFRARRRARFTLQHGELLMEQETATIGRGVIVPNARHQPFGPMELSWGRLPEGLPNNDFHNYWIPDDGEIGELLKLDKFCKKHDVKMIIAEFPTSPYAHTNFDDPKWDFYRFKNALNHLSAEGAEVLPMGDELKLDNTYYEDQAHMNRWGAQIVTDYIYRNVIRKWFPESATAPSLPEPVRIDFMDRLSTATAGITIERHQPATKDAQYIAAKQVLVTSPLDIELTSSLAPGNYAIEIYAGDGTTTTQELTGKAKISISAVDSQGTEIARIPITNWINSRVGVSYTQVNFNVPTTANLNLAIEKVESDPPLILDSAFIRKRLSGIDQGVITD